VGNIAVVGVFYIAWLGVALKLCGALSSKQTSPVQMCAQALCGHKVFNCGAVRSRPIHKSYSGYSPKFCEP
jgi:hypothetical protein